MNQSDYFTPPATIEEAKERQVQLRLDIEAIASQLRAREAERVGVRFAIEDERDYQRWRASAKTARARKQNELTLIGGWLKEAQNEAHRARREQPELLDANDPYSLLQAASYAMRRLSKAGGEPYTRDELALLDLIDQQLRDRAVTRR